tara:strand:- start:488 stop:631 length:144 start_codon:yes stop_codon:yes gene_type:complete
VGRKPQNFDNYNVGFFPLFFNRNAVFIALMKLSGEARFLPAMSKAVP